MNTHLCQNDLTLRIAVGFITGAGISAMDNFAFGGEISPIAIVGLLLIAGGLLGMIWGIRAAIATAIVWVWLPVAHVIKHIFNLADTMYPNTYASILKLAAFSVAVTAIGFGFGLVLHRLVRKSTA